MTTNAITTFSDVLELNANADYSVELRNLIAEADEKASAEDKQAFTEWYADQDFHGLNGIESVTTPSDHFAFAGNDWSLYAEA